MRVLVARLCVWGEGLVNCLTNLVAISRLSEKLLLLKVMGWFGAE